MQYANLQALFFGQYLMLKTRLIWKIGRAFLDNELRVHAVYASGGKPLAVRASGVGVFSRIFLLMVLLLWPAATRLGAGAPGLSRPGRLTLTNKTDSSVTLSWTTPTNGTAVSAYEVFGDDVLLGLSTSNSLL